MVDSNKMMQIMAITLFLRTLKLLILIVNFSYFIGMGWYLMCQTIQDQKIYQKTEIEWADVRPDSRGIFYHEQEENLPWLTGFFASLNPKTESDEVLKHFK